ncbi:MAG: phospholipid carrier-dependent glycosyltransferase, partial [Proteobacteria bacterium]|nr:phospholipid carrier-dependent glycosyltransferase [Pseudomonadota bacterium]
MTTAPNEEPGAVGPTDPEDQTAIGEAHSSTGDYGQMSGSLAATDQMGDVSVATRSTVNRQRSRLLENWVFGLIIALAAVLRFTGVNWDNGSQLHPDERFLFMVEGALRPGFVATGANGSTVQTRSAPIWEYYFDSARSGLNPHNVGYGFFVYGTFPLFATKWILTLFQSSGFDRVHLIGRSLSALSDTGSVALVAIIARRLFGSRVGLLAAALLAVCVLHIQQAHFFVFDSFLVTLVLACFWSCLDIVAFARWRDFAVTGLLLGLTLATKLSMVVFMPVIALAGLIHLWETHRAKHHLVIDDVDSDRPSPTIATVLEEWWNDGSLTSVIAGGILTALVAVLVFRIAQPYAFAGPGILDVRLNARWLDNIDYQAKSQSGEVDLPPSIQWANTTPILFPLKHMVIWGLGIPVGVAGLVGVVIGAVVAISRGRWQLGLVAFWAALCLLYFSSVLNKTMRYLLPAYPFAIILAAWLVVALIDLARRSRTNRALESSTQPEPRVFGLSAHLVNSPRLAWAVTAVGWTSLVAVVAWSAAWSFAFTRIYQRPVSRGEASLWIYRNVPPPAPMANEHWDDPLPLPIPGYDHSRYAGPQLPLYDPDEPKKIDTVVQMLSQSTYLNMTSNRLYGSIPRMPERYPMTTEYYRRLFAGDLGYTHVATIASYPTLGPWTIADDAAEEAFTVYDHPKVLIYKKNADFSAQKVRDILAAVPLDGVRN